MMISVIVPVYRVEPYVRQCVDSILSQTYEDFEVLLIDDGSPDRCGEICEEYKEKDDRVRVFHTENRGLSAARNLGLKEAKGNYIGFVDSDDWIEPDMYEVLLERLEETDADISACSICSNASKSGLVNQAVFKDQDILIALIDQRISNCVWNKLYRKTLFDGLAFPYGKNYEDISCMHIILSRAHKVIVIPDQKYHYRQRPESITKAYSARNLIDYADAHMGRFCFLKKTQSKLFLERNDDILFIAAKGISRVWRWWYGCESEEKQAFYGRIEELKEFSRELFPFFGCKSWPCYLRISAVFMRSSCRVVFLLMYCMNQLFRTIKPERANN